MSKCYVCGKEIDDTHIVCCECALDIADGRKHILLARRNGKTYIRQRIMEDIVFYSSKGEKDDIR